VPGGDSGPLPAEVSITKVFDRLGGGLLILGAPGSGKTTALLELARDLLDAAEADQSAPLPVVFNLSSWAATRGRLDEWLVEELNRSYKVSRATGRQWLDARELLPLLDGLDEVATAHRGACVEAINVFHETCGPSGWWCAAAPVTTPI
jgi:predicted NACHT family NTPase